MSTSSEDTAEFFVDYDFEASLFASCYREVSLSFGAVSHVGNVRKRNEDQFAIFRRRRSSEVMMSSLPPEELQAPDIFSHAMVVADGMGGMNSGDIDHGQW